MLLEGLSPQWRSTCQGARDPHSLNKILMSILLWNVRGACSPNKKKDIRERIHAMDASMALILETKIKRGQSNTVEYLFPVGWSSILNHEEVDLGRVCIGWNPNAWTVDVVGAKVRDGLEGGE